RQPERILVHHFRQIVSQLFEVHFAEFQVQIMREQTLDHGPDRLRIDTRFQEVEIDDVLGQAVHVATDYVKERIDHLRLKFRIDPSDHTEVEEREMTAVHDEQV